MPESAITRLITDPRVSSAKRERRAGAEHDLGRVEAVRGRDERLADVGADDLAVAAAELLDELPLLLEQLRRARGEAVLRPHVHRDEVALRPRRHPRSTAHERARRPRTPVSATTTRSRVSHGSVDPVPVAVVLERVVDAVGDPQQRELAERAEVARCGSSSPSAASTRSAG